jgi:hypothetical protein
MAILKETRKVVSKKHDVSGTYEYTRGENVVDFFEILEEKSDDVDDVVTIIGENETRVPKQVFYRFYKLAQKAHEIACDTAERNRLILAKNGKPVRNAHGLGRLGL